jgi:hypothetical protein
LTLNATKHVDAGDDESFVQPDVLYSAWTSIVLTILGDEGSRLSLPLVLELPEDDSTKVDFEHIKRVGVDMIVF